MTSLRCNHVLAAPEGKTAEQVIYGISLAHKLYLCSLLTHVSLLSHTEQLKSQAAGLALLPALDAAPHSG